MTHFIDTPRSRRFDRRQIVTFVLGLVIATLFLAGSRAPALNEKALMGGDTTLSGLGFAPLVTVTPAQPSTVRIALTTLNWTATNLEGMTFGLLFAAALMTLLSLLRRRAFDNRFVNTVLGAAVGTPLGVCVNCATPIAHGIYSAGGRVETMLATMMSSPTLNPIVLTMLFSLLPWYLAALKLGLTLGFILVAVPLLARWVPTTSSPGMATGMPAVAPGRFAQPPPSTFSDARDTAHGWGAACHWVARSFGGHLWFVVRVAVPLMLLAGVLGATLITVLPLDSLATVLPTGSVWVQLVAMAGVAIFGVLLPVPMAFDVLVTAALVEAGLPVKYAAVLLFTLGIFSVYPFTLIWRTVSPRLAVLLLAALVGGGFGGGVGGHLLHKRETATQQRLAFEAFARSERGPRLMTSSAAAAGVANDAGVADGRPRSAPLAPVTGLTTNGLLVERRAFRSQAVAGGPLFARFPGAAFGVDSPPTYPILAGFEPWSFFRGIAAGDIHNDGWVDIVVASDAGLAVYANVDGERFERQSVDIPVANNAFVSTAALVDLNDDGWLDLFFATFRRGNYVVYNDAGRFGPDGVAVLPNQPSAILVGAAAFGDLERDGDLDVVLGNWAPPPHRDPYDQVMADVWLERTSHGFALHRLGGFPGESLSALLTDLNHDGHVDVLMGNDRRTPDIYHLGDGTGRFQPVTGRDRLVASTTNTTMSLSTGDIDNDLSPEIYAAQIAWGDREQHEPEFLCAEAVGPDAHAQCLVIEDIRNNVSRLNSTVASCTRLADPGYYTDCVAANLVLTAARDGDAAMCDTLPDSWDDLAYMCRYFATAGDPGWAEVLDAAYAEADALPQGGNGANRLFVWRDGEYVDHASDFGVTFGGWAWNAKFADVDNDEWQDLYIVNNYTLTPSRASHYFYHNESGRRFRNATVSSGLTSYRSTRAYTYIDFDLDGDLDIVTVPTAGPVLLYLNTTTSGHSLDIELRDHVGNRFGIGSRITVHYGPDQSRHQMRDILASGGFASFDAPIAHFGLGAFESVTRIDIDWSTGEHTEILGDAQAGYRYTVTRPVANGR